MNLKLNVKIDEIEGKDCVTGIRLGDGEVNTSRFRSYVLWSKS